MNILNKHKVIFLIVFTLFSNHSIAAQKILPLSKPTVDASVKKSTEQKKAIYPKKKPQIKSKEKKQEIQSEIVKINDDTKEKIFVYPKKKPVLVKKKVIKEAKKSKVFSKKDFQIAKVAF